MLWKLLYSHKRQVSQLMNRKYSSEMLLTGRSQSDTRLATGKMFADTWSTYSSILVRERCQWHSDRWDVQRSCPQERSEA